MHHQEKIFLINLRNIVYMKVCVFTVLFLTDALVDLGTVLSINLVDLAGLLVPLTVLPGSSRLRSSVAAVEIVYTYSCSLYQLVYSTYVNIENSLVSNFCRQATPTKIIDPRKLLHTKNSPPLVIIMVCSFRVNAGPGCYYSYATPHHNACSAVLLQNTVF